MSPDEAIATPWRRASLAAALFALDPLGSGLLVRAGPGPARDALLAALACIKVTRLPARMADDRLIGGLDIAATLRAGRPVAELGALAAADGGAVAIAMAERMTPVVAARLCAALDFGQIALQRDGLSLIFPARLGVVAFDEGIEDEQAPAALAERLAFWVDLDAVGVREIEPALFAEADFSAARVLLPKVETPDEAVEALVGVAAQLGVESARAPLFALRAARGLAALRGAQRVEDEDVTLAAGLVLAPRATRLPAPREEPSQSDAEEPEPEPEAKAEDAGAKSEQEAPGELEELVLEAARAAIPAGLLASLQAGMKPRRRSSADGKSGEAALSAKRGRPLDARPGSLRNGRLSLVATLRTAAPWQRLREREAPLGESRRILIKPDDFRILRYRQKRGATTVFVVDASGSAAMQRLAEAKGAIELLLADCYVRRDEVALIAFRGRGAEIALPATRSTSRARKALAGLPGGGGTPIASGLDAALGVAEQARRKGQTPLIVLMTDGRANIGRDGAPGRPAAMRDALDAARRIRTAHFAALAIDTSPPPSREPAPTREIAEAMAARYVKLPLADAALVNAAVRGALPS